MEGCGWRVDERSSYRAEHTAGDGAHVRGGHRAGILWRAGMDTLATTDGFRVRSSPSAGLCHSSSAGVVDGHRQTFHHASYPCTRHMPYWRLGSAQAAHASLSYVVCVQVLHPLAMQPAIRSQAMDVRVKNSYNREAAGTIISKARDMSCSLVTSIVLKNNVTLVDIVSSRMLGQFGEYSQRLFDLATHTNAFDHSAAQWIEPCVYLTSVVALVESACMTVPALPHLAWLSCSLKMLFLSHQQSQE
eukprot:GHUV01028821.1.p1 GENE.GHUV01028821.1~~GHUV01028821.1.p1  ORF type:complete len:246 (+),score=11.93 GHUV01028821.1:474-1211(+)